MVLWISPAHAQFWNFGDKPSGATTEGRVQAEIEKLSDLDVKIGAEFEDRFNRIVKTIDDILGEQKMICSGEVAGPKGILTSRDQKEVCFRDIKKNYSSYIEKGFEIKKKYLAILHQKRLEDLDKIKKRQIEQLESQF